MLLCNSIGKMFLIGGQRDLRSYEDDVILGMEDYCDSYKERFPHKSVEDGLRATNNWAIGLLQAFRGGTIDPATLEKIEKRLNELRLKGMRSASTLNV